MSDGEQLLDLAAEYADAKATRTAELAALPGRPTGREPAEIAADYVDVLRRVLTV